MEPPIFETKKKKKKKPLNSILCNLLSLLALVGKWGFLASSVSVGLSQPGWSD